MRGGVCGPGDTTDWWPGPGRADPRPRAWGRGRDRRPLAVRFPGPRWPSATICRWVGVGGAQRRRWPVAARGTFVVPPERVGVGPGADMARPSEICWRIPVGVRRPPDRGDRNPCGARERAARRV